MLLAASITAIVVDAAPAAAKIDNFSHSLTLSDTCLSRNCPHFLAVTKTKDGKKAYLWVSLTVERSTGTVDYNNAKYCAGTCNAQRLEYGNYRPKHDRTFTVRGSSGHICGASSFRDSDTSSCSLFEDTAGYDSSGVMGAYIGPLYYRGHGHMYTGR